MFAATNQSKFVPIAGGAMAATFGLFYLMQGLVASNDLDFQETPRKQFRDFTIEKITELKAREIERVTPPPEVEPQPEITVDRSASLEGVNVTVGRAPKPEIVTPGKTKLALGLSDGERLPLVRVQPVYPRRALEQGVEGWVILEFTVSEMGDVENAVVVDANPKGWFDRSALAAIKKYKYKPTVVDGQARATPGVQFRMVFEMAENG